MKSARLSVTGFRPPFGSNKAEAEGLKVYLGVPTCWGPGRIFGSKGLGFLPGHDFPC